MNVLDAIHAVDDAECHCRRTENCPGQQHSAASTAALPLLLKSADTAALRSILSEECSPRMPVRSGAPPLQIRASPCGAARGALALWQRVQPAQPWRPRTRRPGPDAADVSGPSDTPDCKSRRRIMIRRRLHGVWVRLHAQVLRGVCVGGWGVGRESERTRSEVRAGLTVAQRQGDSTLPGASRGPFAWSSPGPAGGTISGPAGGPISSMRRPPAPPPPPLHPQPPPPRAHTQSGTQLRRRRRP